MIPFVVRNGAITVLTPPPSYTNFFLAGINNRGVIAGYFYDGSIREHGFTVKDGAFTTVDAPGCTTTSIAGINASGDLAGQCDRARVFLLKNGKLSFVAYPGSLVNYVYGLNDRDDMVGAATLPQNHSVFWVYRDGVFETVEVYGVQSFGKGINASGQIAGEYVINGPNSQTSYGVIFQPR